MPSDTAASSSSNTHKMETKEAMTIEITPIQAQVIRLALLQLRVSTHPVGLSDQLMLNTIIETELNILNQTT